MLISTVILMSLSPLLAHNHKCKMKPFTNIFIRGSNDAFLLVSWNHKQTNTKFLECLTLLETSDRAFTVYTLFISNLNITFSCYVDALFSFLFSAVMLCCGEHSRLQAPLSWLWLRACVQLRTASLTPHGHGSDIVLAQNIECLNNDLHRGRVVTPD